MRNTFTTLIKPDDIFIHPDCWNTSRFPLNCKTIINVGMREQLSVNIAMGAANSLKYNHTEWSKRTKRTEPTVYLYGTCQFVMNCISQFKHSYKGGKIIFINAGAHGYDGIGPAHNTDDIKRICQFIGMDFYLPSTNDEFIAVINKIKGDNSLLSYVGLGADAPGNYKI